MSKQEIRKKAKVGRWVRTRWDDVGARDGILVEKVDSDEFRMYTPYDSETCRVSLNQIEKVGNHLAAGGSGL